ncbi:AAT family amino acid transporter [Aaosphaeria arxii CBS 175.79]|uniref:AAT family amino acid transporter n=1 Tax=Aaosphaeria arxii CBS 175.79 TaxID=1450172 RepID=A0A6A5Y8L4_9PLEO|nr:AAT family amino acid transporter [Aaosphaeria arxii CBS 175.79]KAF2021563.1 AAT family amino acid transporter [Aaosphaeria arxii CBS 175.79]
MADEYRANDPSSGGKDTDEKMSGTRDLSQLESHAIGEIQLLEDAGTKRNIKSRHAQMIAIGGTIGTGLFVGAGQALAIGGPAFTFMAYCLTSLLVYGIISAIIEVATFLPLAGCSMAYYANRFVSPSIGFALGWLYFYSFGILVAYEITAAGIVISFWPNSVHIAVWITIMMVVIIALNFAPVGIYAETEFWFAGLKVIMIIGLLFLAFILALGGGPTHDRLGFRYWNDPGATKEYLVDGPGGRFTAFLYVWVFSGFSFYFGPELIVFTAGEMRNPRKNLPTAGRRFFARLVFFYILGALAIGVICNSNADGLTSGTGNANASPWVIAIRNARIEALPSIVNAGVLISAWSAGNAYLYMSSRALYSLAIAGNAPRVFTRCNRYGLPVYSVLAASCFAPLAYLNVASTAGTVFNWFISLTNTAGYTSWIICTIVFLRFRRACTAQGISVPYQSKAQPYGAWVCLVLFTFLLLMNGFTQFFPGQFTASGFLTTYLGIPLFLMLWLGHKLVAGKKDPWLLQPLDVDLTTGLREVEHDAATWTRVEEMKHDKLQRSTWAKKIAVIWG